MKKSILIEFLDQSEKKTYLIESEKIFKWEFDRILEVNWEYILNSYSAVSFLVKESLNKSDILSKFNDCLCMFEYIGKINCSTWGLCGISENSSQSSIKLTKDNKIRYVRFFLEYNTKTLQI